MNKLQGVCPPVATIFDRQGNIDYEANRKLTDFLIKKGVDGLAYLGTTGEFGVLTLAEKKQFIREMTAYVDGRVKVIAGTGDTCLANVLELYETCREAGVDGTLIVPPYFSIYGDSCVEAYFDKVASSTELPILLYNFPALTGYRFEPDFVLRLARKHKNIAGIKETVDDPEHIKSMMKVKEERPDFSVFAAYETHLLAALIDGADGIINAGTNFAPEYPVAVVKAFRQGDMNTAVEQFSKMKTVFEIYGYSQPMFIAIKEAVYQRVLGGKEQGERLPAVGLDAAAKQRVAGLMERLGLDK